MRTNKVLTLFSILALTVAIGSAGVVIAQTRRNAGAGGGFHALRAFNHLAQQLNLTDQQRQQIKDLVRSHKEDIKALIDQGFAERKALREAIVAGNNDQISAAVNRLSAVELKGAELEAQLRAKVFNDVLQADQRAKAEQLLAQFQQKADQRRQRLEQFLDQM